MKAQPYINWGRFVVDCPVEGCHDARQVDPGQSTDNCAKGHPISIEWPKGAAQVMAVLAERPDEQHRNWFPDGHPFAVATGQPHGQSVAELRAEANRGTILAADKADQVRAAIAALGLEFDPATGLVKGL